MTSLNGGSEDNTLAEVGQPDGVSPQKEEAPDTMDTIQDEVAPQVNGEKVEKESSDANDITAVEEKAVEEKPEDASEVGFKKIFRFVGFKFTLKKDKSEEKDPVKLLTVKDKEEEEVTRTDESAKKEEATTAEEKSTAEEKEADLEATKAETTDAPSEDPAAEATDEPVKEEGAEKEGAEKEGEATSPSQETTLSPLRKLFSSGLFSNLRKKTSIKKTKEEEDKDAAVEEENAKTEETAAVEEKEEKIEVAQETKEETPVTPEEEKSEHKEEAAATEEEKSEAKEEAPAAKEKEISEPKEPEEVKLETTPDPEVTTETPAPAVITTDETKQDQEKAETGAEEEKAPAEVTSEAELLSSQEKAKPLGSPLKKLFTGAGLKKLSAKKQKTKKDAETKLTESGEQAAEQLQSSTESAEAPKTVDSGPSSPEESGAHAVAVEETQNESSQETEGEVASDGEKKKEGIIAWSSFKKLVTPKKRVKRSSESEDEATGEKPAKSATLSSSESAALADMSAEEETKEEKSTEEEPKTENTEKLVSSTEEPKKKMDTSVSWEALMCMGGPKKRARKTSDSDDDEMKIEEGASAVVAEGEQEGKSEAVISTSQNAESEGEAASPTEPLSSPPERESAWDTLKRMVMPKNKAKSEDKPEESPDQVQSDSEAPKDESSFSLRKFFPGRRKKKAEKQASTDVGSGEEDSDTPAVVPLSEYEEQTQNEQEAPAEPAAVQIKVSAEERSPSWIPASIDIDDKHDQLSDIPEEAENAATPKSVDTDIAEDESSGHTERRLSTAEVKPVPPAAETIPVTQGPQLESAEEVVGGIEAQISEIPLQTSVTVEDVPVEVASEKNECEPPTEKAESKTNAILELHASTEATSICTGLGTKEVAKVALEKPVVPVVESVTVVHDVLTTEVSVTDLTTRTEEATATEAAVLDSQVHQVEVTKLECVKNLQSEVEDIRAATENYEPQIEKVGVVSTAVGEFEVIQPTTMSENSPNAVVVCPITATSEAAVHPQSVEVSEPNVEAQEVKMDTEQLAATEEYTPIKEVIQVVTEDVSSTICEAAKTTITKETEPATPVVVPSQEVPVITETVVMCDPVNVEFDRVATSDMLVMESPSVSEPAGNESIPVPETKEESAVVETLAATAIQAAAISAEEIKEDVQQAGEIEAKSMVIAQAVIQDAVDQVSEDSHEPKKPTTPTATIPTPAQATATTEKEIEVTTETPIITDTPITLVCEKPAPESPQLVCVAMEVTDTILLEVTESIDSSVKEEQKKPEEELKQAVEVNVSEETVILEEVEEIKTESQTGEELEQVKEEQSKEDSEVQETEVKETAEEVKPQSEETQPEVLSEENKMKVPKIHVPVQVVLKAAEVVEEPSVEAEAVVEFDSNGPAAEDTSVKAESPESEKKLLTVSEESQVTASAEVAASSQVTEAAASQAEPEKTPSVKCAEVMAQVIEVIEEAVKEIEPVSTEITAAS
ncbi:A-kinase anchor protein 12b isoform X2 [Mastacembelus armatus]|nr:A-kinase anchor protein 12 isoform X2 [Mastacembelus armatus]